MPIFEARIYKGDERVNTRDIEAATWEEADRMVRDYLATTFQEYQSFYDVEIVTK